MASKKVVQQCAGEAAVAPIGAKKMAVDRKNRRALGDIGNLVSVNGVDGKPIPKTSRPVTRGFAARLLGNEHAAKAQTDKNSLEGNVNEAKVAVPEKRAVARRPTQKKVASIKPPKPEEITEISHGSDEVCNKIESKKKAPTLTSTLTARSKAAIGLSYKRKEKIIDIDSQDVGNDLAVVEYVEEIYKFYKSVENDGRAYNYMGSQPEINERMRAILIDWLIQVHYKFELALETLYLTINIVDRYLASESVSRRDLQLVGMSAMLIASKYEEIWAPQVNDIVCISDRTYTSEQVLVMEKRILGQLEWNMTVTTPYVFLVRFIKASLTESDVENMVYFLGELAMVNYEALVYSPSMLAASAVYVARCTLSKAPIWNGTLETHTGFSEQQLVDCVKMLVTFHCLAGEQKLKAVYRKYSSCERGAVALLLPAKSLLADS